MWYHCSFLLIKSERASGVVCECVVIVLIMSGGVHNKWSQSLQKARMNGVNKVSPFLNKCLLRAKAGRERNIRKLRAGLDVGYGYAALAAEIMNELRDDVSFSLEEDMCYEEELQELSRAIRIEYDISEYMLYEEEESQVEELNWSQIEMSEIPEEILLLCPYCRYILSILKYFNN